MQEILSNNTHRKTILITGATSGIGKALSKIYLKNDNDILFLSHTVIPEVDTVQQLKKYSIENKVNDSKWNLVTGDKKQIYDLARKSYLAVEDTEYGEFDMIHTENFMLIDKKGQIRGFYDGTNDLEIDRLLSDIEILKKID